MADVSTPYRSLTDDARNRLVRDSAPYVMSVALGLAVAASAGVSLLSPSVLAGTEVTKGNLRGTALVLLTLGLPVLAAASVKTAGGSARAVVVWLGTLAYLLYQAVLFCFGTPVNDLFLFYVAYLGLAVWSIVRLVRALDLGRFGARLSAELPARAIGGLLTVVVTLNALAWLGQIVPALIDGQPETIVKDTGLLTNPVFVQDLSVWLPLGAVAASACWRRQAWGQLVAAAMLAMFVLESFGVAADQWFGSRADPGSESASMSAVPVLLAMAVLLTIPLVWYLRGVDDGGSPATAAGDGVRRGAG